MRRTFSVVGVRPFLVGGGGGATLPLQRVGDVAAFKVPGRVKGQSSRSVRHGTTVGFS